MSYLHLDLAAPLELGHPTGKLVLFVLAGHACGTCGIAWPGTDLISRRTGLGVTAVKGALHWLVRERYLLIHAYPRGGRGRSTEFVVLPQHTELSTAPCGECHRRMKTRRQPPSIDENRSAGGEFEPETGRHAASNNENQSPEGSKTSRVATPNQSENRISHARAREEPPSRGAGQNQPAISEPPLSDAENAHRALELANALGAKLRLPDA